MMGTHRTDMFLSTSSGPVASYGDSNTDSYYNVIFVNNNTEDIDDGTVVIHDQKECFNSNDCSTSVGYASWDPYHTYYSTTYHELYNNGISEWSGISSDQSL